MNIAAGSSTFRPYLFAVITWTIASCHASTQIQLSGQACQRIWPQALSARRTPCYYPCVHYSRYRGAYKIIRREENGSPCWAPDRGTCFNGRCDPKSSDYHGFNNQKGSNEMQQILRRIKRNSHPRTLSKFKRHAPGSLLSEIKHEGEKLFGRFEDHSSEERSSRGRRNKKKRGKHKSRSTHKRRGKHGHHGGRLSDARESRERRRERIREYFAEKREERQRRRQELAEKVAATATTVASIVKERFENATARLKHSLGLDDRNRRNREREKFGAAGTSRSSHGTPSGLTSPVYRKPKAGPISGSSFHSPHGEATTQPSTTAEHQPLREHLGKQGGRSKPEIKTDTGTRGASGSTSGGSGTGISRGRDSDEKELRRVTVQPPVVTAEREKLPEPHRGQPLPHGGRHAENGGARLTGFSGANQPSIGPSVVSKIHKTFDTTASPETTDKEIIRKPLEGMLERKTKKEGQEIPVVLRPPVPGPVPEFRAHKQTNGTNVDSGTGVSLGSDSEGKNTLRVTVQPPLTTAEREKAQEAHRDQPVQHGGIYGKHTGADVAGISEDNQPNIKPDVVSKSYPKLNTSFSPETTDKETMRKPLEGTPEWKTEKEGQVVPVVLKPPAPGPAPQLIAPKQTNGTSTLEDSATGVSRESHSEDFSVTVQPPPTKAEREKIQEDHRDQPVQHGGRHGDNIGAGPTGISETNQPSIKPGVVSKMYEKINTSLIPETNDTETVRKPLEDISDREKEKEVQEVPGVKRTPMRGSVPQTTAPKKTNGTSRTALPALREGITALPTFPTLNPQSTSTPRIMPNITLKPVLESSPGIPMGSNAAPKASPSKPIEIAPNQEAYVNERKAGNSDLPAKPPSASEERHVAISEKKNKGDEDANMMPGNRPDTVISEKTPTLLPSNVAAPRIPASEMDNDILKEKRREPVAKAEFVKNATVAPPDTTRGFSKTDVGKPDTFTAEATPTSNQLQNMRPVNTTKAEPVQNAPLAPSGVPRGLPQADVEKPGTYNLEETHRKKAPSKISAENIPPRIGTEYQGIEGSEEQRGPRPGHVPFGFRGLSSRRPQSRLLETLPKHWPPLTYLQFLETFGARISYPPKRIASKYYGITSRSRQFARGQGKFPWMTMTPLSTFLPRTKEVELLRKPLAWYPQTFEYLLCRGIPWRRNILFKLPSINVFQTSRTGDRTLATYPSLLRPNLLRRHFNPQMVTARVVSHSQIPVLVQPAWRRSQRLWFDLQRQHPLNRFKHFEIYYGQAPVREGVYLRVLKPTREISVLRVVPWRRIYSGHMIKEHTSAANYPSATSLLSATQNQIAYRSLLAGMNQHLSPLRQKERISLYNQLRLQRWLALSFPLRSSLWRYRPRIPRTGYGNQNIPYHYLF